MIAKRKYLVLLCVNKSQILSHGGETVRKKKSDCFDKSSRFINECIKEPGEALRSSSILGTPKILMTLLKLKAL